MYTQLEPTLSSMEILFRQEFMASKTPLYYHLDKTLSLDANLQRKAVVEYPQLLLIPSDQLMQYTLATDTIEVITTSTP